MRHIEGYTIEEVLDRGTRNVTYRAHRIADGTRVVLKTTLNINPSHAEVLRYRSEYALLRQLRLSPFVSEVAALEMLGGCPVLSMKDDGGQPLDQILGRPLALDRFLRISADIARALSSIHIQRIIHKDIKPQNILLVGIGQAVKLIDFAIATQIPVEYRAGEPPTLIEGTWAYMSPEQTGRMNRGIDYRSDLYSLGVTLYRMLTGVLPFQGKDPLEWCHLHMTQPVTPPHVVRQDVPPVLSEIIIKLLAKVAEERYQSASGLVHDLEQCEAMLRAGGAVEHFVLGRADRPQTLQIPEKLYGRERELAELVGGFEQVKSSSRCGVMLIAGPSGIGKSSLAQELQKQLVQVRGIFISGKFDQLGSNAPYHAFLQAYQTLIRHILAEDDASIAAWRQRIMEAVGARGRVLTELIPEVELIIGPQPEVPELNPAEAQNRFQDVLQQFVRIMARADSPLIVFLDDMQWADSGTLKLLQAIVLDDEIRHIFFVLGYRDNEVSLSHPFAMMLEELRRNRIEPSRINVGPLDMASLRHLIADTLHTAAEDELALELTELVAAKTGGNPFFVIQFLRRLYHDGVLYLDTASGGFTYARDRVVAQSYTDNVVEHMVQELRELPPATQQMLKVGGCIGAVFALADLSSITGKKLARAARNMWPAIQAGLILPIGNIPGSLREPDEHDDDTGIESIQYRFLHDRIQQAAYALTGEEERIDMHLAAGRCWLKAASSKDVLDERLFAIVSQMNLGISGLKTAQERLELARLNLRAAKKASASAAQQAAVALCRHTLDLLGEDRWAQEYQLTYEASLLMAESAYMSGELEEADHLCLHLLEHAVAYDSAPIYALRTSIAVTRGRNTDAVEIALSGLHRFGMDLPAHPQPEDVTAVYDSITALMAGREIEDLCDLPTMEDPGKWACMEILLRMFDAAFFTDSNLAALHIMRMVELSLRFGNHPASPHGYGWFGILLVRYQRYEDGYRFTRLMHEMVTRANNRRLLASSLLFLQMTGFWCRPIHEGIEQVTQGCEVGLESGAHTMVCYNAIHQVDLHLIAGEHLDELYARAIQWEHFSRRIRYDPVAGIFRSHVLLIQQLRGKTNAFDSFDEGTRRFADFDAEMATYNATSGWYHNLCLMFGRFMAGDLAGAMANGARVKELLWAAHSLPAFLDYHYIRGLVLARLYPDSADKDALMNEITEHQRQLKEWCEHNPSIFEDKYLLLSAELARLRGQDSEAMYLYTRAISSARVRKFPRYQAIAYEIAAYFCLDRELEPIATTYLREAHRLYQAWGAYGKAADLARRFALDEGTRTSPSGTVHAETSSSTFDLDAGTLVKSIQAISSEVHTSHLVKKLLAIAAENAGAHHAWMVVFDNASATVWTSEGTASALDANSGVSASVIAFVKRTRESLLLTDALHDPTYNRDPAIQQHGVRSLLCLPLVRHGEVVGCLYLENRLLTDAFSHKRRAVLEVIATQAAISLDNAKLYDTLEERVAQRTRELEQAQKQLVETAHQAGMAEIASSILHNVGNVLSSLGVSMDVLQQQVRDLRVAQLSKATTLIDEHRESLGEFFTTHRQGQLLPSFLSSLVEHLRAKENALKESIAGIRGHLSHIEAVVAMQERYALHGMRLVESSMPRDLVEDALRLSDAALARHHVTIVRNYGDTEPQSLEKHRVLQILINLISNAKNAMNATPESQPRRLSISTEQDERETRIIVADTGHGFHAEVQEKLFMFGFTTRKDGHGLGLHSCALQAQAMGGSIEAHSEGPGRGARFVLTLPRA